MTSPDFSKHPEQAPPTSTGPTPPPGYGPAPGYGPPPGYGYGAPQAPYGQPPYGQAPYGYGQPPYGYGQAPYGYGHSPYGYGQAPYAAVQKPVGWFVVNWLFFWPLAIYSLVSAWGNIDRALFVGDVNGAQYHANRVKKFGVIGLCIGLGLTVFWIVLDIVIFASFSAGCNTATC